MKKIIPVTILFLLIVPNATLSKSIEEGLFLPRLIERRAYYEEIVSVTDEDEKKILRKKLTHLLQECIQDKDVDKSFEGPLHFIIKALGELQAKEAIPVMLECFLYVPDSYRIEEIIPTQWYYPVARALTKIGKPSIVYMQKIVCSEIKLQNKDRNADLHSDEAKKLAAWVMMEVLGKEKALEKLRLLEKEHQTCFLKVGGKLSDYIQNFEYTCHNPRKEKPKTVHNLGM